MAPKVFIIGATGYIGGDFLFTLFKAHPEWSVTCLVRNASKAARILDAFPQVTIVRGDLDSITVIETEVTKADIVFDMADCDHVPSARAVAEALSKNPGEKVYWVHTSGTGTLTYENFANNSFGESMPTDSKIYDDWDGIRELTSLPDFAIHREVDKIVLAASMADPDRIKTAIVCPSCIYGTGRGTGNRASKQVNIAAQVALSAGAGIQVGHGTNHWNEVHVRDLSKLYLALVEDIQSTNPRATWNEEGFYLVESGSFTWGEVMQRIANEAFRQGFIDSNRVRHVSVEESRSYHKWYPYICATTSRANARRAKALLSWTAQERRMSDEIADIVHKEAAALNLTPSVKQRKAML